MTTSERMNAAFDPLIAGFWVRLLANLTDAVLWGAVATLIGLSLVAIAPTVFGLAGTIVEQRDCKALAAVPTGIPVPAELSPTGTYLCSKATFGLRYRTELIIVEQRQVGAFSSTKAVTYPVTADLQIARTVDVDRFLWAAFLVYIVAGQARFGTTLGKRLLRLRVLGPTGELPGLRRALVRNGVLLAPAIVGTAVALILLATGQFYQLVTTIVLPLTAVLGLLTLALATEIWWTATHGRPSIHDRIAGTRVVRLA